ncbi:MAG: hypothetical protein IKX84_04700 [Clostridia bacterium]|nr:hypothetical protein [Clostridia bacterium]
MKKVLLIVLALMLACAVSAEGVAVPEGAEAFRGDWQADGTFILMDPEEEHFRVLIIKNSEDGQSEWEYSCLYDEETGTLVSLPFGVRREVMFDENGEFVSSDEIYEDGRATFLLDGEGRVRWLDEKDDAGRGLLFERLPEFAPPFADMTEALEAEGFTGMEGASGGYYVAAVVIDGRITRVVAELDETAAVLEEAIFEAEDLSAAAAMYEAYLRTLPVTYLEEITQVPLTAEELDALKGMTVGELEEAGFEALSYGEGGEAFILTMSLGMYDYDFTVNEPVDIQAVLDGEADYAALTVGGAEYAGLSPNVTDLDYMPDGTYCDTEPDMDVFGDSFDFMSILYEGLQSGEMDLDTLAETLKDALPDQAEQISDYIEMFRQMYGADAVSQTGGD